MTKHQRIYLALTIIYTLLASCSKKQAEEIKPNNPSVPENPGTEKVTYNNFTGALLQTRCSGCHAPGRSAAAVFTFNGYASVTANAERIRQAVIVTRRMPPGGSLSAAELESLSKWFAEGMPEQ
jgi:uncharacterized membrane protein